MTELQQLQRHKERDKLHAFSPPKSTLGQWCDMNQMTQIWLSSSNAAPGRHIFAKSSADNAVHGICSHVTQSTAV